MRLNPTFLKSIEKSNFSNLKNSDNPNHNIYVGGFLYQTMLSFLICNNVTPIHEESGRSLQAASPDEIALVKFAESMGFLLVSRKLYNITVQIPTGEQLQYKIISNFPFSSEKKVTYTSIES